MLCLKKEHDQDKNSAYMMIHLYDDTLTSPAASLGTKNARTASHNDTHL